MKESDGLALALRFGLTLSICGQRNAGESRRCRARTEGQRVDSGGGKCPSKPPNAAGFSAVPRAIFEPKRGKRQHAASSPETGQRKRYP